MNLLRLVTELVDKDIAANSKPFSLLGIAVPLLPFMLFGNGAPADQHPVLSGLALGASFSWGAFVIWRAARHLSLQPSGNGKLFGMRRASLLMLSSILFIVVWGTGYWWLSSKVGWPETYGFQCYERRCLFLDLAHSPRLLTDDNAYALALFALLWTIPACLVAALVYLAALFWRRRS